MNPARCKWIVLGALLGGLWSGKLQAETNTVLLTPPAPPVVVLRSPVESFRVLLLLPAAERKAHLANRAPEAQQRVLEKVREYLGLPPEERELRLLATELRWFLKPLMTVPATNRTPHLAAVPEHLREMISERLAQWDRFPPAVQQMMLTNQAGPGYFVSGPAVELPPTPPGVPPLPGGAQQRSLEARFNRLFELTATEKTKVLATLSPAERAQMEKTLAAFTKLTPAQREQCLVSFSQFAGMSPAARQEFLKNADRWAQMSAQERQAWRELVSNVPQMPPLPMLTRLPPPLPRHVPKPPPLPPTTNGG